MKRLLSLLLISTLLAAGCTVTTKPEPVPPAPQPEAAVTPVTAPEKPDVTAPEPAQTSACGALNGAQPAAPAMVVDSAWGSVDYATFAPSFSRAPACRVTIGGGEVRGWVMLPADAEESLARAALTVEGGTLTHVDWTAEPKAISFMLAAAPAGSTHTVRFRGAAAPGGAPLDLSMTLVRDWPTVSVDVRQGAGDWSPLDSLRTYPPGAYTLRFRFSRPVEPTRLVNQLKTSKASWQWLDKQTLEVSLSNALAKFELHPGGLPDERGVGTWAGPAVLYTGDPATLVAVDPESGQERVLATLPPEVSRAFPSPDGARVALQVMQPAPEQYWQGWAARSMVLDLNTAKLTPLPDFSPTAWAGSRLLGVRRNALVAWDPTNGQIKELSPGPATNVSPDGRYATAVEIRYSEEDQATQLAPVDLVVVDLTTDTEGRFTNVARHWVCHCDGRWDGNYYELWEGDLFYLKDEQGARDAAWLAVNVRTGEVKPAAQGQPKQYPAKPVLSGPGGYRLTADDDWAPHTLVRPDGTRVNLGPVLPAGWLPDGRALLVRWPGYADRYRQVFGL